MTNTEWIAKVAKVSAERARELELTMDRLNVMDWSEATTKDLRFGIMCAEMELAGLNAD